MKHYFLFGEEACSIMFSDGFEELVKRLEDVNEDSLDYELYIFEDGVTSPLNLLNAYYGYRAAGMFSVRFRITNLLK